MTNNSKTGPTIPQGSTAIPADLVSIYWACFRTDHSPETLLTLCRRGDFPRIWNMGRKRLRVSLSEFDAWIEDAEISADTAELEAIEKFSVPAGERLAQRRGVSNAS